MTERYGPETLIPSPLTVLPDPNLQFKPKPKEYLIVALEWGFDQSMVAPSLSFDDLLQEARTFHGKTKDDEQRVRARVVRRLGYDLRPWPSSAFSASKIGGSYFEIVIDVATPYEFLKEEIMQEVNFLREVRGIQVRTDLPKRKGDLYEKYLKVFDLAESGMMNLDIATIVFNDAWEKWENDELKHERLTDQDSLLVKVSRYKTEANRLVNGGYKEII